MLQIQQGECLMKKSIIERIYFDNESLSEHISLSEKYKKMSDESYKFYKQLIDILDDDQRKIFERLDNSEMGLCAEGEYINFKEGLKVGLLLAMECLI